MSRDIIKLDQIDVTFHQKKRTITAVKDVTIHIQEGDIYGIVGYSGAGKSTLVRVINLLQKPSAGKITIDDDVIFDGKVTLTAEQLRRKRQDIGMIFQHFNLMSQKTAEENVAFALKLKKVPKKEIEERVEEALKMVQLNGYQKRSIQKLSGGQRQRVAIARAIINQPRVVLLDEPLSALDLKLRTEMQYELRELQQRLGITFVFVTHDQEEALAMSDWIFVMNDGEIVQSGTPVDIYDEPINHFVATFIGESNILPGVMIEDYLVEFNGKRFESVDGGMRPNEPVEVVIRPEDLQITLPEEGKLQVRVETQLFRGVHYEIIAYDNLGNEWMIHSTRKAIEGEIIGLDFTPEDIHIMRLNETEEEFDARIEEYVEVEEHEDGLINAIEEERYEENS